MTTSDLLRVNAFKLIYGYKLNLKHQITPASIQAAPPSCGTTFLLVSVTAK